MLNTNNLPEIDFVDKEVESILSDIIKNYKSAYYNQTGEKKELYPGDPIRIFLYSQALREYQLRQLIDYSAKQNILKYAEGDYLINRAADRGVTKLDANKAKVAVEFKFSTALSQTKYIEKGIRVTPGNDIFFEVPQTTKVEAGLTKIIITLNCTKAGIKGNNFLPGQINTLVDPISYVKSVSNIEKSQGGTEVESEDSLRERAWLAPESYSVAGPKGAYIFHVKSFSNLIKDVMPISPSAGVVEIYVLLEDGNIPGQTFLNDLLKYISAKDKRPLTDNVIVKAPIAVDYNIDLTYYISSDESTSSSLIKNNVESAIDKYKYWQGTKIGRDINPDQLIHQIKSAGAKRVSIINPIYKKINDTEIAKINKINIVYGGLENG